MKVSIEGVPGSGKTTILRILQRMGYNCYMEGEHNKDNTSVVNLGDTSMKLIESSPYVLRRLWELLNVSKNSETSNRTNDTNNNNNNNNNISSIRFELKDAEKEILNTSSTNEIVNTTENSDLKGNNGILLADWTPDYVIFLDCQPDICVKRLYSTTEISKHSSGFPVLFEGKSSRGLSALQVTELYLQLEWILHPVNCEIPTYRVNASGSILHTLHCVLAVLNSILIKIKNY